MTISRYCDCGKLSEINSNHSTNPNHWGLCKNCFKSIEYPDDIDYKGFKLRISPLFSESDKRPSWESQLCGYRGTVWQLVSEGRWEKRQNAVLEADSLEALEALFEGGVDAILDSL